MRLAVLDGDQRLIAVAREPAVVALVFKNARDEIADIGLVIDNKNIGSHPGLLPIHAPASAGGMPTLQPLPTATPPAKDL